MGKNGTKRGTGERPESVSRRAFLSKGAAGVGAAALVGASANKAKAQVKGIYRPTWSSSGPASPALPPPSRRGTTAPPSSASTRTSTSAAAAC